MGNCWTVSTVGKNVEQFQQNVEIIDGSIIGNSPNSISSGTIKKKHVTDRNAEIDFNIAPSLITNARDPNTPLGLRNEAVNVCFFNSVIQVLYSLPMFRNYIHTTLHTNRFITEIRKLF